MLSGKWKDRRKSYDFIVVGSGYGGAIAAARLVTSSLNPKPTVCILERGREWPVGKFPDTFEDVTSALRTDANPMGLYEIVSFRDISVLKGSGLGGTSLINANVAATPDPEVFDQEEWPAALRFSALQPYIDRAKATLGAKPHPKAWEFKKVEAMDRRARQMGARAFALDLAINYEPAGINKYGVLQRPCLCCGDCVIGCNNHAKGTLYMNYLPMASRAGAEIYTRTEVEWVEQQAGGGWRVHGKNYDRSPYGTKFTLDAANVILAAGAINSTEILMRSENRGLPLSERIGTRFSANGDFFGVAYNSDYRTQVIGFGSHEDNPAAQHPPGPSIVSGIHYDGDTPLHRRIQVEDLTFPSAFVGIAQRTFASIRGEDSDSGDEAEERKRILRDLNPFLPYQPEGALNHTMLYLVMSFDDARGRMVFEKPWNDPRGRVKVVWDEAGRQEVYTRLNAELRRHARAQGASFISNPLWSFMDIRHLLTAHPIGGCPLGEDYTQGAVDEFGRVFSADGQVHDGLFVADGALLPSSLGVNPFLTISALAERIVERKIRALQGDEYPQPPALVPIPALDPLDAPRLEEPELEKLFERRPSLGIEMLVNSGTIEIDPQKRIIRNDAAWKGFFPKGHILNPMSSALFIGFKKAFRKEGARHIGVTSDTDERILARNTLEEIKIDKRTGDLEPGTYILLRYLDPPWQGFYDLFKIVGEDFLIGRVYLGEYPNGARLFTFPMTRVYGFNQMTVSDHARLWNDAHVPTKENLQGVWRMDAISNANQLAGVAHLQFDLKGDGRLESRFQLMGLVEGIIVPSFLSSHFQLTDFTPFHDEIRRVSDNSLVGKYVMDLPPGISSLFPAASLGLLHVEAADRKRFGFYYTLTRTEADEMPANRLLQPFLEVHLPSGIGMTFDEEMVGWYWPGQFTSKPGREGDLEIARRMPRQGNPADATECSFKVRMTIDDINEFIDGGAHEARSAGTLRFGDFEGQASTFPLDDLRSRFHYLIRSRETGEAEMRYHLEFGAPDGRRFLFDGRKYMQKDERLGERGLREALEDFTTLFCHVYEKGDAGLRELGTAYLKFRTFEDFEAIGNLAGFLYSFKVTGTQDPLLRLQAQMRFLAFTAQFLQREYDPLAPPPLGLQEDVRVEVLRGAETPDYFSTRSTPELQEILRETPTRPLDNLLNSGEVRIDFQKRRIFRDCFWKGSFAKDSLLGWEERVRNSIFNHAAPLAALYAGGSFWKRFNQVEGGVATGHVVNYELDFIPGKPEVRALPYPDNRRQYFRLGDEMLLLTYLNEPYRIVYDTIKIIDDDSAIGVMHLGQFPNGLEFSTFVMERHNYPFEKMSVQDHHAIFRHPKSAAPTAADLLGSWQGHLILIANPNTSLLNQINPAVIRLSFEQSAEGLIAHCRLGLVSGPAPVEFSDAWAKVVGADILNTELRLIDHDTLLGRWSAPDPNLVLSRALQNYLEPAGDHFVFHHLLTRS